MSESLVALGAALRVEFAALLDPAGATLAVAGLESGDWRELDQALALARVAWQPAAEVAELVAWLTSGYLPELPSAAPSANAAADEDAAGAKPVEAAPAPVAGPSNAWDFPALASDRAAAWHAEPTPERSPTQSPAGDALGSSGQPNAASSPAWVAVAEVSAASPALSASAGSAQPASAADFLWAPAPASAAPPIRGFADLAQAAERLWTDQLPVPAANQAAPDRRAPAIDPAAAGVVVAGGPLAQPSFPLHLPASFAAAYGADQPLTASGQSAQRLSAGPVAAGTSAAPLGDPSALAAVDPALAHVAPSAAPGLGAFADLPAAFSAAASSQADRRSADGASQPPRGSPVGAVAWTGSEPPGAFAAADDHGDHWSAAQGVAESPGAAVDLDAVVEALTEGLLREYRRLYGG